MLNVGDIVKHFKKELLKEDSQKYLYRILAIGDIDCDTLDKKVVYQSLENPNEVWIRNYEEFIGQVDKQKYPNIKQADRFEKVYDIKETK